LNSALLELEENSEKLQAQLSASNVRNDTLSMTLKMLEGSSAQLAQQLTDTQRDLDEKTTMLTRVMHYLQSKPSDDDGVARDGDGGEGNQQDASRADNAYSLDAAEAALVKAAKDRQAVLAALQARTAELAGAVKEQQALQQQITDVHEELGVKMSELAQSEQREEALRGQVEHEQAAVVSLTASLAAVQDELASAHERCSALERWTWAFLNFLPMYSADGICGADELALSKDELACITAELERATADMQAAAQAGLSLTDMLANLRTSYEQRIDALTARIFLNF
jgi:chromosome segregation ATPase